MGILRLPGLVQTTQPQSGPIQLDSGNPYSRGVVGSWLAYRANLLTNAAIPSQILTASGSPTFPIDPVHGQHALFNGSTQYLRSTGFTQAGNTYPLTLCSWIRPDSFGAGVIHTVMSLTQNGGLSAIFQIFVRDAAVWAQQYNSGTTLTSGTSSLTLGQWVFVAAVFESISSRKLYLNGALVATDTATATSTPSGMNQVDIGASPWAGPGEFFQGAIASPLAINRALLPGELRAIASNPWQLFRSPQRVMLVAAGPDVIVALTGQATSAVAGTVGPSNAIPVAGSAGTAVAGSVSVGSDVTVALAGQAVTASRGTLAPVATKALTGQSSTATQGSVSQATSAGLTGQASSAQQGLLTPARAIVISGQSSTASAGAIGPGTVAALTGQASATQQGVVATSGNKTVALTGQSVSVAQGALTRSTPEAVFALATIMRQSAIAVQAGTMKSTVAAQGGTIKATIALSTIMRQSQINTRATMTNASINRTVAFI